jgi:hypothetical protein
MDDPSSSCAVLEEPGEAEVQRPDLMADADIFCIIRSAHNHEVGHHGVERTNACKGEAVRRRLSV